MKSIIALLLSCVSILAGDDIGVTTTIKTNAVTGAVVTVDSFTRGGQTNLLCKTTTTNGVFKSRSYQFVHDGKLAAEHISYPGHGFSLTATHYDFDATFLCQSNTLYEVDIYDKNRQTLLDVFVATNGMLTPIPTSELRGQVSFPDVEKPKTNNETSELDGLKLSFHTASRRSQCLLALAACPESFRGSRWSSRFTSRVGGGWYVFQSYSAGGEERRRALPAADGE